MLFGQFSLDSGVIIVIRLPHPQGIQTLHHHLSYSTSTATSFDDRLHDIVAILSSSSVNPDDPRQLFTPSPRG